MNCFVYFSENIPKVHPWINYTNYSYIQGNLKKKEQNRLKYIWLPSNQIAL